MNGFSAKNVSKLIKWPHIPTVLVGMRSRWNVKLSGKCEILAGLFWNVAQWHNNITALSYTSTMLYECTTFAPATVAPKINANVNPNPNPNPNLNPYLTPNQKLTLTLTLTLTLSCRRYHRRGNCRRSKSRIHAENSELLKKRICACMVIIVYLFL